MSRLTRRMRGRAGKVLLALWAGLALAACGSSAPHEAPGDTIRGHDLTIYTSLPLRGASAFAGSAVLDGERLALARVRGRIGQLTVTLHALDDASIARGGWDPGLITQNAHYLLADPTTIAYVGDFNSGATAVAIPPLNVSGMLVLSPTSTSVGLTTASLAASPGEPDKYYPTGKRTFVRLSPDDSQQAATQVAVQRKLGCRSTYVLDDGEFDGHDVAASFELAAKRAGLRVLALQSYDHRAQDYSSLALSIAQTGASCVLLSALPENHAALLARQLGAAMPHVKLFGTSALAQPSFTEPADGGIPPALDARVFITAPAPRAAAAAGFDAAFARRYGPPDPYAVYGYEAMRVVLDAIARATDGGRHSARRSAVLSDVLGHRVTGGPLGDYTVTRAGETTLRSYAVFTVDAGDLVLWYELP